MMWGVLPWAPLFSKTLFAKEWGAHGVQQPAGLQQMFNGKPLVTLQVWEATGYLQVITARIAVS
jgi:hypothetical protein